MLSKSTKQAKKNRLRHFNIHIPTLKCFCYFAIFVSFIWLILSISSKNALAKITCYTKIVVKFQSTCVVWLDGIAGRQNIINGYLIEQLACKAHSNSKFVLHTNIEMLNFEIYTI